MLARLAMFGLGVVLARTLGAADYGRYGLGVAAATIVLPLSDLGTGQYLAREMARSREGGHRQLPALRRARILSGLVVNALAFALVAVAVDDGRTEAAVMLALAAAGLDGLAQFTFGYFQGLERMRFQANLTTGVALARAGGGIAIAVATGSLLGVLAWSVAVGAAQAGFSGDRLGRVLAATRAVPRSPAWRTVLAVGAVTIFVNITLRADSVLIGVLQSERQVGYYTAAWALMGGLQIVPWMLAVALGPVFARTFETDRALYRRSWNEGLRAVVLLAVPVALLVSLLADPLVALLFGPRYEPTVTALAILAWSVPLAGLNSVATLGLRGAGRERVLVLVMATGAVFNVGLNLWAIGEAGIDGAAAVNVGTELLVLVGLTLVAARLGLVPLPRLPLARLGAALAALAAAAVLLRDRVPVELAAAAAAAAYAAVAWRTALVTRGDLAHLRRHPGTERYG